MTLAEIEVACRDPKNVHEGTQCSWEEAVEYMRWWHNMTPEERLWAE